MPIHAPAHSSTASIHSERCRPAKVPTDVTEDVVRELALPRGLVDVKVCAIDATWSGLRLVWRTELRAAPGPPPA